MDLYSCTKFFDDGTLRVSYRTVGLKESRTVLLSRVSSPPTVPTRGSKTCRGPESKTWVWTGDFSSPPLNGFM